MNDNAYKIDLLGDYNVSVTYNVKDLSPCLEDVDDSNLRTNYFQPKGDDMHHDSRVDSNMYGHLNGSIMRAWVK